MVKEAAEARGRNLAMWTISSRGSLPRAEELKARVSISSVLFPSIESKQWSGRGEVQGDVNCCHNVDW